MGKLKYARKVESGEWVKVYRNLNTKLISVMDMKGRVIAHVAQILLSRVSFIVRKNGREKVLKEKRKNVHAFVKGIVFTVVEQDGELIPMKGRKVGYNPYKYDSFVELDGEKPLKGAMAASITKDGKIEVVHLGEKFTTGNKSGVSKNENSI